MSVDEVEILVQVLSMVAGLAFLVWGAVGVLLRIAPAAAQRFSFANLLVLLALLLALLMHDSAMSFKALHVSDVLILSSVLTFRAGLLKLFDRPCAHNRHILWLVLLGVGLMLFAPHWQKWELIIGACSVLTAWFCAMNFHDGNQILKDHFNRSVRYVMMLPFAAAALMFLGRGFTLAFYVDIAPLSGHFDIGFGFYLWVQLLLLLLINSSLISMTVGDLVMKIRRQATTLQKILDAAPVGVAVTTDGVVRFANPKVTELLNVKVGDTSPNALVHSEDHYAIVALMKRQGIVRDYEVQMYDAARQIRDLMVTYLPTEFEGKKGVLGWMIDLTERKKFEKKIMFNRTVVENAEPMFWICPKTQTVVYANKAALDYAGYKAEEFIGQPVAPEFSRYFSKISYQTLMDQLRSNGKPLSFEIRHRHKDGSAMDVEVSLYVAEDDERALLVGSVKDITERKRSDAAIRHANEEQTAILESATLGIAVIKDQTIVRCNHKLEKLFGYERGDLLGRSPRLLFIDDESYRRSLDAYSEMLNHETHHSTLELMRRNGEHFWCRCSGSLIASDDSSRGSVWMFEDVTEERLAAELMRQAKEMAEEATRMKSDFLANMSHEIRTPMNAIIGMTHLALQTDLDPKQRNYIEKVESASRSLLGVINDILDFSKIEAGKLQFERVDFDLEDVLENLADLCAIKAQDKGLELLFDMALDVPTALKGDPLRLGQVLVNLVGNAIKFTEQGEITVAIRCVAVEGDEACLRFEITDSGVGLTQEQCGKLFNAFAQADASTTRRYGGTGLGLSISKRLVDMMNGEIGVVSQPGLGSDFHFTARFGVQSQQRQLVRPEGEASELRILAVDDNARAREVLLSMLASQRFEAQAVGSGYAALQELAQAHAAGRPYGLVLIDWMMPDMDGVETLRRIRADATLEKTPAFVMVTAYSRDELLQQAHDTRIDGVLQKPVNPSTLLDGILNALGKDVVQFRRKDKRQANYREAENRVRGAYVLLAEDNPVNRELALEILGAADIRVDVAVNGEEAVARVLAAGGAGYDGVLMDCQMPVMDGFEATRRIRADARFAQLPILAMTANAMAGDKERCVASGMNDHIAKPIDVAQFFITLAAWVTPRQPPPVATPAPAPMPSGDDAAESVPALEGVDVALALRRVGGNAELLQRLMGRFCETQTDAADRIRAAISVHDVETAARDAHTLKGLAGNIGAQTMAECAAQVEALLKCDASSDALGGDLTTALQAMERELARLLSVLAAAAPPADAETETENAAPLDRAQLRRDLQKLAVLLAEDDSSASQCMESIAAPLSCAGHEALVKSLGKLIARYDFEGAMELLKKIAEEMAIPL